MILENYYHILGLDISATQKQIDKRGKEILKYLAIGDIPDYPEVDFSFTKSYRNEAFIKDALNGLKNPKIRLQHIFLWINIETEADKHIVALLQNKKYEIALLEIKKIKNLKNKAVFLPLILSQNEAISILGKQEAIALCKEAIDCWNLILLDDKKWMNFEKSFYLYDDISTNTSLIQELRENANKILADIFFDISNIVDSSEITRYFTEIFHVKGTRLHGKSEGLYLELSKISDNFENIKISDDGIFDSNEKKIVNSGIKKIQDILGELSEMGLGEDSKTLVIKDKVAHGIKSIAYDLWKNLDTENEEAIKLIKMAKDFAGTNGLKERLKEDIAVMEGEQKLMPILTKLNQIEEKDDNFVELEDIYNEIKGMEKNIDVNDNKLVNNLRTLKRRVVNNLVLGKWLKGRKFYEEKNYINAQKLFGEAEILAKHNVHLFDGINEEGLNNIIISVKLKLNNIRSGQKGTDYIEGVFKEIDDIRSRALEKLSEQEGYFVIAYIDSISYGFLSEISLQKKNNNNISSGKGFLIIIAVVIGVPWLISSLGDNSSSNSKSSSSSYSSPQFDLSDFNKTNSTNKTINTTNNGKQAEKTPTNDNVTVGQYTCSSSNSIYLKSIEPVDPGLKKLSDEVDSMQSALDSTYVDQYSQVSVNNYNKKVKALNAKIESYKVKQTTYNNAVDKYNNYLDRNCTKRY
ncbi:MAG: hypothetical protein HHAS10_04570 [Candidatus Altimarinota bacterium]